MKLLLTVAALVAVAHASPISQTMEIGANGISGSVNIPLVEIIVNMIKGTEATPEPVDIPEPVMVVDEAQNLPEPNPIDVIAVNPESLPPVIAPAPVVPEPNPIDVIAVNPESLPPVIAPAPVVPEPNPIDVIAVNPDSLPPVIAPAPVVPEPNPVDVIAVNPVPVPPPAVVVPAPIVLPEPVPAEIVEVQPVDAETPAAAGSQIINVMMNFIFGDSGALSSIEVPSNVATQIRPERV